MNKNRSFWGLLLDLILIVFTGGIWFIWILIRYLMKRKYNINPIYLTIGNLTNKKN